LWLLFLLGALSLWPAGWVTAGTEGLGIGERVACQRAIEEVYWKHTIWPEENKSPKPSLNAVLSDEELSKKAEDPLRMSNALAALWKQPVQAKQLQAEMGRMAGYSNDPDMLRELWQALWNDPQKIAECMARPLLAERELRSGYAYDERFHGELKRNSTGCSIIPKDATYPGRNIDGVTITDFRFQHYFRVSTISDNKFRYKVFCISI